MLLCFAVHSRAAVFYVDANSSNPTPPYSSWSTAATDIQSAIDASTSGDQILVTNGIYQTGSRVDENGDTNRIAITKPITVESVNGPAATTIDGGSTMRCAYLTNGATLSGFTLMHGYSPDAGGGAAGGTLIGCLLATNSSPNWWTGGGGAGNSTLLNCTLAGNFGGYGGGANGCAMTNCLLTGNSAFNGGGTSGGTLDHCTLVGNSGQYNAGGANSSTLISC